LAIASREPQNPPVLVTAPRVVVALLVSGLLCATLATRVALGFQAAREKVVTDNRSVAAGGMVRIAVDAAIASSLPTPFAVISRLRNDSPTTGQFHLRVDGQPMCDAPVSGGGISQRVDCAWNGEWTPGVAHTLEIQAAGAMPWRLEYLELATHHGATRAYDLIVVPSASRKYARPSRTLVAVCFVALSLIFLMPPPRAASPAARVHRVVSAGLVLLLLLILAAPYLSPYAVLVSADVFWTSAFVIIWPRIRHAARVAWVSLRQKAWGPAAASIAVAIAVFVPYAAVVAQRLHQDYHGNYSGFLQLDRANFERHPVLSRRADVRDSLLLSDDGYDGQFMYYAAFDPFLRAYRNNPATYRLFIDAPPYRFSRIGFSLLTNVVSAGRWAWFPTAMTWLILLSLFACGLTLALIACDTGTTPAWGLLIAVVPAFWQSLQTSLPEPIAGACLLAGCLYLGRDRWRWAGGFFALALLVRETCGILVLCLVVSALLSGRRRRGVELALISFVPFLAWRVYVWWVLSPDWGLQALWFDPQGFGPPFSGPVRLWTAIRNGQYYPGWADLSRAGIWYPILLIGALAAAVVQAAKRWTALSVAAVLYGVMAISLAYPKVWSHVANAQRGTFELFLVLALVSLEARHDARSIRWGMAAFWIATTIYVFFGAHDADFVRHAAFAALS
jgi:hypothetical protein